MHLINSTWLSFTLFILIEIVRDFSQDYHFGTKKSTWNSQSSTFDIIIYNSIKTVMTKFYKDGWIM